MTAQPETAARDEKEKYERIIKEFRQKVFIGGDFEKVAEYLTSDFVDHFALPWEQHGREGAKKRFGQGADAFSADSIDVQLSVYEDGILIQAITLNLEHSGEFMGVGATTKKVAIGGFDAFRFQGDKIAEHWGVYDVSKIPDLLGAEFGQSSANGGWSSMWQSS